MRQKINRASIFGKIILKIMRNSLILFIVTLFCIGGCRNVYNSEPLHLDFSSKSYKFNINILFKQLNWDNYYVLADSIAWCAIPNIVGSAITNCSSNSKLFIIYGAPENDFSYIVLYSNAVPFYIKIAVFHNGTYTELYNSLNSPSGVAIGQIERIEVREPNFILIKENKIIRSGSIPEEGGRSFLLHISYANEIPFGIIGLDY